jgi:hypothetical protein
MPYLTPELAAATDKCDFIAPPVIEPASRMSMKSRNLQNSIPSAITVFCFRNGKSNGVDLARTEYFFYSEYEQELAGGELH